MDKKLWSRALLVLLVLSFSWLAFAPNILPQRLVLAFQKSFRDEKGKKQKLSTERIRDFIQDRENGLLLFFPETECKPEAGDGLGDDYRCVLEDHFITAARVNELIQAYPQLINSHLTRVLPHPIENFFGRLKKKESKNLKIKLGLDLQGGMRAVFRADFESYIARLREKLTPHLRRLENNLKQEKDPEKRNSIEAELRSTQSQLEINTGQKLLLLKSAKDVIDKRLASQNLTEPEVRVQEESYSIAVDMPGVANSNEVLSRIKDTVTVEYRIVNDEATERIASIPENQDDLRKLQKLYRSDIVDPQDIEELFQGIVNRSRVQKREGKIFLYWRRARNRINARPLPRELRVLGPPLLDGSEMESASYSRDPNGAWFAIYFRLSEQGATKFGDLTKENVGKRMAILWGDRVVSDPNLNEPIYGGSGQITGQFTEAEAKDISNVIREGALPIPLELLSISSVGPSLGRSSITIGIVSILIGYAVVLLFMLAYYRWCGLVAVFSLFCNLLIMMAIMSLLEFTFTLPGIAGIILTVGMAVDASVIIFEKIKEDLREGKPPSVAVENGFQASLWTILDANITTLIAAIILWLPRDGPIMGFAIVLFFGLLSSMFTALYLSRLLLDWSLHLLPIKKLSIGYGFGKEGEDK